MRDGFYAILPLWTAVGLMSTAGCGTGPCPSAGSGPPAALDAVTVVKTVYELEGRDRGVLFVDIDGYSTEALDAAVRQLAEQLPVAVLPGAAANRSDLTQPLLTPVHPETGEPGLWVRVLSLELTGPREAQADVEFARSGLDGGILVLTFEQTAEGWQLTGVEQVGVA